MANCRSDETVRLSGRVRYRTVAGEGVMVHLARGRVLVVNQVGLHVVKSLAQRAMTVTELAEAVAHSYGIDLERARQDVVAFLDQLRAEQAIETVGAVTDEPTGE